MSDCCTDACCCGKVIDATVVTPVIGSKRVEPGKYKGSAAKVFFSPIIDAEHLIKLYNLVNSEIYGRSNFTLVKNTVRTFFRVT